MNEALARALIAVGGSTEMSLLVKATAIMLAGFGAAQLAAKARASVRHLLLASTFFALLLLPAALPILPAAAISIDVDAARAPAAARIFGRAFPSPSMAGDTSSARISAEREALSTPSPFALLRAGWAVGFTILIAGLGMSLWRLSRIRRLAYPWPERHAFVDGVAGEIGLRKPVALVLHEDVPTPITCGLRRPAVILPSDATTWSDADVRRALVHEMEHIRRNDWAVQLIARAACALYWFHPLVWQLWRQFCLEAERACDDAVLNGAEHADYADQLVQLARRISSVSTVATLTMASRSDLSTRVSAILDEAQKRGPVGMLATMTTLTTALGVTLALASLQAVPQVSQSAAGTRQELRRPTRLDVALFEAAQDGDIADMTGLIRSGANVNAPIPGDGSALMGAARRGHIDAVRFLLDQGADPNLAVGGDGTALIVASRAGHAAIAILLLDRGADLEQIVPGDENPLIQASGSGKLDVARLLVLRGANVNARAWAERANVGTVTGEWRSPLSMARRGGHQAVVAYLISAGAID